MPLEMPESEYLLNCCKGGFILKNLSTY